MTENVIRFKNFDEVEQAKRNLRQDYYDKIESFLEDIRTGRRNEVRVSALDGTQFALYKESLQFRGPEARYLLMTNHPFLKDQYTSLSVFRDLAMDFSEARYLLDQLEDQAKLIEADA